MRIALDTNILVYAEGINGGEAKQAATSLLARLQSTTLILPAQVLGELYNVLERKGRFSGARARQSISDWSDVCDIVGTTDNAFRQAVDLAADHRLQIWDAVILSVASTAACRLLLSEDMQDGFTWGGVTVIDPFATSPNPLLASALRG